MTDRPNGTYVKPDIRGAGHRSVCPCLSRGALVRHCDPRECRWTSIAPSPWCAYSSVAHPSQDPASRGTRRDSAPHKRRLVVARHQTASCAVNFIVPTKNSPRPPPASKETAKAVGIAAPTALPTASLVDGNNFAVRNHCPPQSHAAAPPLGDSEM